jgi:antitoxin ParD1/3/4
MDATRLPRLGNDARSEYFARMDDLRINLSVPEHAFLGEEATETGHASPEDYAAELVRAGLKARAQAKLEALLLEGLEGEATEWTEADWDALRRRATGS